MTLLLFHYTWQIYTNRPDEDFNMNSYPKHDIPWWKDMNIVPERLKDELTFLISAMNLQIGAVLNSGKYSI